LKGDRRVNAEIVALEDKAVRDAERSEYSEEQGQYPVALHGQEPWLEDCLRDYQDRISKETGKEMGCEDSKDPISHGFLESI
jgi:hypothetical protein